MTDALQVVKEIKPLHRKCEELKCRAIGRVFFDGEPCLCAGIAEKPKPPCDPIILCIKLRDMTGEFRWYDIRLTPREALSIAWLLTSTQAAFLERKMKEKTR